MISRTFLGSKGTGCLALFKIADLRKYKWYFNYIDLSKIEEYEDNKTIRVFLEQKLRNNTGWPILCSE